MLRGLEGNQEGDTETEGSEEDCDSESSSDSRESSGSECSNRSHQSNQSVGLTDDGEFHRSLLWLNLVLERNDKSP